MRTYPKTCLLYTSGGNQIQVELSFQTLLDNLHVQQSQKSAAESKAQRLGGLRLKGQRSVVELQLVQRVAQVGIFCTVCRIDAAERCV